MRCVFEAPAAAAVPGAVPGRASRARGGGAYVRVAARIASLAGASSEIVTHASRSRSGALVGRGGAVAAAATAAATAARGRRGGLAAGGRGRRAGGTVASARSRGGRGRDAVNHRACSRVRGTCGARPGATARGRQRRATAGGRLVHCHPGRAGQKWFGARAERSFPRRRDFASKSVVVVTGVVGPIRWTLSQVSQTSEVS